MFGFKKNKPAKTPDDVPEKATIDEATPSPLKDAQPSETPPLSPLEEAPQAEQAAAASHVVEKQSRPGLFARLKAGLTRTRSGITDGLADLVLGKKAIDDDVLDEIETLLLTSDVGVEATQQIVSDLTGRIQRKQLADADALFSALREEMSAILAPSAYPLEIDPSAQPFVILMVGINGAGKTTTIGKLAKKFQNEGKSVMLAAGDTFRAAAVEQLQEWGRRNDVTVVAQHSGADSVDLSLKRTTNSRLELTVIDNGKGFDPKEALAEVRPAGGMGLAGMRDRTEFTQGRFEIISRKDGGTILTAVWTV